MIRATRKQIVFTTPLLLFLALTLFAFFSGVDNSLSDEDRLYIPKYLSGIEPLPANPAYKDELAFIVAVQRSVLDVAPVNEGLPYDQLREPKELYEAKIGLCFDRSRAIEKILQYSGFETRHIFILSTQETGSALQSLVTSNVPSHAVTEVRTSKGWLVVDSNDPWVSVDKEDQPVSMQSIQDSVESAKPVAWKRKPPIPLYSKPFTFIYGLYSRHGRFYPPYNFIPDIQYGEFVQNLP